ncbi:abortive infection family protein [Paenibacillus sp. 453mf]|uniref:abortive infection family protein n=1 Tax=Paenibacillus sp. 453mf TaxID=1761874 RepID=UPI0008F0FF8F|nr:abortive infection family protein [Paenibacillus sp. 453mf]SFS76094.1 Abortive infection C-terminus [Paenibacillus sp. 453mf]
MENPEEILKSAKNAIKNYLNYGDLLDEATNKLYEKSRHIIMKLCNEESKEVPTAILNGLDVDEFLSIAWIDCDNRQELTLFIQHLYNPYINMLAEKSVLVQFIKVEFIPPNVLTYEHIKEELRKCESKLQEKDYSGAITNARSLLEGVLKEIIFKTTGNHAESDNNLVDLSNQVRECLNLDPARQDIDKPLKQVITGLASTIQGLGTIRNRVGDSHSRLYEPSEHHAVLVVNASKTVCAFLFGTYQYQLSRGSIREVIR